MKQRHLYWQWILVVAAILLLAAACGRRASEPAPPFAAGVTEESAPPVDNLPGGEETAEGERILPTDVPLPSGEPGVTTSPIAPAVPVVLFQDDFSDSESGWEHYRQADGTLDYEGGGYLMQVQAPGALFWVNAGLDLADAVVEVDVTQRGGVDSRFGVMCRLDGTTSSYYAFLIDGDGRYGIARVVGNRVEFVGSEGMLRYQGAEWAGTNRIRATCEGENLSLSVNGLLLLTVRDSALRRGDVGLVAGNGEEAGVDVLFDDFVVLEP
ncbi:MAG: hypothetical protein JW900_10130 [Anaerolineae bacterium]|nr:hypothetical protein [Anaerolineae bacterium]